MSIIQPVLSAQCTYYLPRSLPFPAARPSLINYFRPETWCVACAMSGPSVQPGVYSTQYYTSLDGSASLGFLMPPSRRQLALTTWLAGCSLSARAASRSPRMHRAGIEDCIKSLHISHPCGIILSPSAVLCIIRIILLLCIIWYYVLSNPGYDVGGRVKVLGWVRGAGDVQYVNTAN